MPLNILKKFFSKGTDDDKNKRTIIIANENPGDVEILCIYLEQLGYATVKAENAGKMVVAVRGARRPYALFMDIAFSDNSAVALAKKLRTDEKLKNLPLVFLCPKIKSGDSVRVRKALPRSALLSRPYSKADVQKAITKATGSGDKNMSKRGKAVTA
ncbi:MAG: hypothetical protein JXR97_08150 [Planctomycetes bacterium]|nr:hypothetical protein [Planctomycetota bacterium]